MVALAAASIAATPALADEELEPRGEIGLQLGLRLPEGDVVGPKPGNDLTDDVDLVSGVQAWWAFDEHLAWFVDGTYSSHSSSLFPDANFLTVRSGLEARFKRSSKNAHWFLALAPGWMDVDLGGSPADFDRTILSVAAGRRMIRSNGSWRYELRTDTSLDNDGLNGERVTNISALVGWSWGVSRFKDSDGDGVRDGRDDCPDTPKGATVDEKGCPKDRDEDGVYDGIDQCPDTPKGWPVDEKGCPTDSDGDGVPDGGDDCPDTPKGASVDDAGCPTDEDGDGVYDGLDECPGTPTGATVDTKGCPSDSDGDSVFDGIDACPDTPKGAVVDERGCPIDSDGDGVVDGIDQCPDTPAGASVDETGCPIEVFSGTERTLILEGVSFGLNSADLTAGARSELDRVADSLAGWPDLRVEIGGHTDSTGSDEYNERLSERRAESVRDYLVSRGVEADRLATRGYGESEPIADNGTSDGRAMNRRVELKRLD
jgi:outer membrane protein OmpA-like peptidoglycan-associated protein